MWWWWWALTLLAAAAACAWAVLRALERHRRAPLRGEWVLLVIAHPDDESMFFGPLLGALRATSCETHVLCLSTGDADGLGVTRVRELRRCCRECWGIPESRVSVLNDPGLRDGFGELWATELVAERTEAALRGLLRARGDAPAGDRLCGSVVSFDEHGVSGHPNHSATHRGVRSLALSRRAGHVAFFQLESVPLLRKYLGPLDLPLALAAGSPVLVASTAVLDSFRAMAAHASQFVWYRRLFIVFSRYTFINTLRAM
jgi:N-acetylglucosaminylphosphatidylinositol deacetylase